MMRGSALPSLCAVRASIARCGPVSLPRGGFVSVHDAPLSAAEPLSHFLSARFVAMDTIEWLRERGIDPGMVTSARREGGVMVIEMPVDAEADTEATLADRHGDKYRQVGDRDEYRLIKRDGTLGWATFTRADIRRL